MPRANRGYAPSSSTCAPAPRSCRDHGLEVTTLPSELVFIRISDGSIVLRRAGPTRAVPWLGYSEDGQRLVLGTEFTYSYGTNVTSSGQTYLTHTWYCQAQYMTRAGTALANAPPQASARAMLQQRDLLAVSSVTAGATRPSHIRSEDAHR